jgi:hypothetical protein
MRLGRRRWASGRSSPGIIIMKMSTLLAIKAAICFLYLSNLNLSRFLSVDGHLEITQIGFHYSQVSLMMEYQELFPDFHLRYSRLVIIMNNLISYTRADDAILLARYETGKGTFSTCFYYLNAISFE